MPFFVKDESHHETKINLKQKRPSFVKDESLQEKRQLQTKKAFFPVRDTSICNQPQQSQYLYQVRAKRKRRQLDAESDYDSALLEQLDWVKTKKGPDIRADLLDERRQFILEARKKKGEILF